MKKLSSSIIFGIAIILAAFFLGKSYVDRAKAEGTIQVTGSGEIDFTSDLIVWECDFSAQNMSLKDAYNNLENNKDLIKKYLEKKGVPQDEMVFSAVKTREINESKYSGNGEYIGTEFKGYLLSQTVEIESEAVEKTEIISREITELLNDGVQLFSGTPRYYYTKLADLKIELISKATEDAKLRADKIAEFSGGKLGDIQSANMGVFQITGQNSNEDYSWGGTFNTSDKHKTASITIKLVYEVD
ncbi:MAG TPA: SIMPL domain-containing protein [Flavobacteriaceae bacterium]|nr:SIMPL domain-containing protein [Flavobacteriaceae bacterium]